MLLRIRKCLLQSLLLCTLVIVTLPVFAKNTILIMGDSLSTPYGMKPEETWVSLLQARLAKEGYQYDVVNNSSAGDTSTTALSRLPDLLRQYYPQIIIIALGENDGLRGIPPQTIMQNLDRMIILSKELGTKVLLVGVRLPAAYGGDYVKQFLAIYPALAKNDGVPLVGSMLQDIDTNKELMSSDGIHPTSAAQAAILALIWPQLEPILNK